MSDVSPAGLRLGDERHRAFLVTRRADGYPTAHPLTPLYADGAVYFNTYRKSAKVTNVLRDPRVSVVVIAGSGPALEAAEGRGLARIAGADDVPSSLLAPRGTGDTISQADLDRVRARLASGKRIYLRIEPDQGWRRCPAAAPGDDAPAAVAIEAGAWAGALAPSRLAMSAEEVAAFVDRQPIGVVGTLEGDGAPRGTVARLVPQGSRLDAVLPAGSPLLDDVAATGRACATVEEFPTYDTILGVMVHGPATVGEVGRGWARVELTPGRVVSFDFGKIPQAH